MQGSPVTAIERTVRRGLRFVVLQRDDFTCRYCGAQPPSVRLEVDHIIPRSRGGQTRTDNLITACFDCNQGKKAKELTEAQIARFSIPIAPKPVKVKPPKQARVRKYQPVRFKRITDRIEVPLYNGGHLIGNRETDYIPESDNFVYVGPDTFIGTFRCQDCGFVNTYEGDHCSCRRKKNEPEYDYCDCGELLEPDDDELCRSCHDRLYVYCWDCEEIEQLDGSNYCVECAPKYPVRFLGGVRGLDL